MSLSTPSATVNQTFEPRLRAVPTQSLRARSKCETSPGPSVAPVGGAACAGAARAAAASSRTTATSGRDMKPPPDGGVPARELPAADANSAPGAWIGRATLSTVGLSPEGGIWRAGRRPSWSCSFRPSPRTRAGPRRPRATRSSPTCRRTRRHGDAAEPEPAREQLELLGQRVVGLGRRTVLDMGRVDAEEPGGAVGLEVDAGDERVAEQERQHVVAVDALGLGHVDLEPEADAEQALDAAALPQQVVEGAEQRARLDAARDARVAVQVGR